MYKLILAAVALLCFSHISSIQAAPLPDGTLLTIEQGTGSGNNTQCSPGSCFSMTVNPDSRLWTDFGPGTDGGLVIGKNQATGGQDVAASSEDGEVSAAWFFFTTFGTFYTPDGATLNIFDDQSCTGPVDCLGKTELGSWFVAWNGISVPMGAVGTCPSINCVGDEGIQNWQVLAGGTRYSLDYKWVVPDGDPSGFGNIIFGLHLEGEIILPPASGPTIAGIVPATAAAGETVHVYGEGFDVGGTSVSINGIAAASVANVTSEGTVISFVVPAGDTAGSVDITTAAGTTVGPLLNSPAVTDLGVTAIWPESGPVYSIRLVFGSGFVEGPGQTQMSINGVNQQLVQWVTPEIMAVLVDGTTTTGPVTVTTNAGSATSASDAIITP